MPTFALHSLVLGLGVALASAISVPAAAQVQSTAPAERTIASDPAAEALLKRYLAANDPREAQRVFEQVQALAATSPRAAYVCGTLASRTSSPVGDRTVAMRCLESAASAGIPEAQHELAALLLADKSANVNARVQAERWLVRAAPQLPESVYLLALMRADQSTDPQRSRREVVEKAAHAGYPPAQYELARRLHGEGERSRSREWLEKAAARGHAEAAAELALQLEGDQREHDISRIVTLLEQGSRGGSPLASYALAKRLLDANGVRRDTERALELFQVAALAGHVPAQYALGYMLQQGIGAGSDEKAAVGWFARAANNGYADAMFAMGNSYANGWGVGQSMDMAYRWYCRAANAGHKAGREFISRRPADECPLTPVAQPPEGPPATRK